MPVPRFPSLPPTSRRDGSRAEAGRSHGNCSCGARQWNGEGRGSPAFYTSPAPRSQRVGGLGPQVTDGSPKLRAAPRLYPARRLPASPRPSPQLLGRLFPLQWTPQSPTPEVAFAAVAASGSSHGPPLPAAGSPKAARGGGGGGGHSRNRLRADARPPAEARRARAASSYRAWGAAPSSPKAVVLLPPAAPDRRLEQTRQAVPALAALNLPNHG